MLGLSESEWKRLKELQLEYNIRKSKQLFNHTIDSSNYKTDVVISLYNDIEMSDNDEF